MPKKSLLSRSMPDNTLSEASKNPSVGVYYRDGKPCKRKPKKETEG